MKKTKKHLLYFILLLSFIPIEPLPAQCVGNSPWKQLVPSAKLPEGLKIRDANNNLDVIRFKDKYYIAFRTAPSHFASKKTQLHVLSSLDLKSWQHETSVYMASDLREPRFFIFQDELYFMYFKGGTKMFRFQPQGIFLTKLNENNKAWEEAQELDIPLGYVPWRIIPHQDKLYLSTYDGMNEYKLDVPAEFRLFVSEDAYTWQAISEEPQISHKRAIAEIEIIFDDQEDIWGVARLEFDGSYLVHASYPDYSTFEYWYNPHKFDSPLLFQHDDKIYLIARRNLDGPLVQKQGKHKKNLLHYSLTKKTTALYLLDPQTKSIIHIKDFTSTGDCAFPGISKINDKEYLVLNYSSNIKKREKIWLAGQLGKTYIYESVLHIDDCQTFINASTSQFVFEFIEP